MPDADLTANWNAFLQDSPFATHYVTPNYFIDPYIRGERFAVLASGDGGEITAALTGIRDDQRLISGMFSRPQLVFGRNVDRGDAVSALVRGLDEIGDGGSLEVFSWESVAEFGRKSMRMSGSNDETSIVMLDLSLGADAVFAGFSQTRRNEIRKSLKQQLVEVKELETEEELAELYQIHCDWNTRKGTEPDSYQRMKIAAAQVENRRIFIARTNRKTIAGSFYRFCPGGVVEYAANFSMPQFQKLRPNDLIGWYAIQWACGEGFSHFSMGGSHLFLRRFGGEIMRTYRYRRDRSFLGLSDLRENARDLGMGAYKRLPESVRSGMRKILSR